MAPPKKTRFWADTETGSECALKLCGAAVYAEHPSTHVQLFSYACEDGPVQLWDPHQGELMPKDLRTALNDPDVLFTFHNAWFDRLILQRCLDIHLPLNRLQCSMAQALSHGLPGSLDKCGEILGIREDARKHRIGQALMQMFCKPKPQKDGTLLWNSPETHPNEWQSYREYCRQDTAAMREIVKRMPTWNYPGTRFERDLWELDQIVNERGLLIDVDFAQKAMGAIAVRQTTLAQRTHYMTNGMVETASQRDALLLYINDALGVALPNMQKATLERIVGDDTYPEALRTLLEVRLDTCTTSTAKYKKMLLTANTDGRIRGTIQFSGASRTARDAGRLCQVQNFPSRGLLPHEEILAGIGALKADATEVIGFDVMWLCSSALRYTIMAPPDKQLVIADLSNIEGRVLAWLAGEEWKLQAFQDYDAGIGHDLYVAAYARAFQVDPVTVTKDQRQIGKVLELSLGYQGGAGGMLVFTTSFDINVHILAKTITPTLPRDVLSEAESFYDWLNEMDIAIARKHAEDLAGTPDAWRMFYQPTKTYALPRDVFAALDGLKRLWRRAHPATVRFWAATESACRDASVVPETKFYFGNGCYAQRKGKWVRIVLPSGHSLPYPGMRIGKPPEDKDVENAEFKGRGTGLWFKGVDQFSRKWSSIQTHGGKLVENCTQAFARDVFKYGELAAERAGYRVILPLHDENVTEVPENGELTVEGLEQIMSIVPPWAEGLPLAAKGFSDYRYHKSTE